MSSTPNSEEPEGSLGVRRQIELPEMDTDAADDLAPASGTKPETEPDGSASPARDAGAQDAEDTEETATRAADAEPADVRDADVARGIAGAVPPGDGAGKFDGTPPDRPKKPVLAGVAIGGVVLLSVPVLLIGRGAHHDKKHPSVAAADTVLPGQQPPPGAYTSTSPTPTPTPSASASAKPKPKASKTPQPKHSAKPSPSHHAAAHRSTGVPASEKPTSGGNPYALKVLAPFDINAGKTLRTNRIALTMQKSGNLVLRDTSGRIIWSTGTHHSGAYAEMQTDGNLVVYINGRQAVWAAGTVGHNGASLVLQADDNMVIYDGQNAVWATGTNR